MSIPARSRLALLALVAWALVAPWAAAQEEHVSEVPKRQTAAEQQAQRAAQLAAERVSLLHETVTYQQVLADPDNLDLNFRYAKAQAAHGDLLGASATLERILMIDPRLAQARLFHAIVLLQLDSLEDANRELTLIRGLEMPADVRRQVEDALRQIQRKRRRTNLTYSVTTGWGYDRNRNAAPSSKNALVLDLLTPVEGTSRRRHDTAFLMIHSLDVAHDLGAQAGHQLVGSATYFLGEQTRVDDLDLQSFSLQPGLRLKTPWVILTPRAVVDHVTLSRETYSRTQGGRVEVERALTPRLGVSGKTDWLREDFSGINESSAAAERRGSRITVDGGVSYLLAPSMQLSGSLAYDRKNAKAVYYTYDGLTVNGTHTWILPRSQFILNTLELELNGYDGADPAISGTTRHDEIFRYRLTYGVPVAALVPLPMAQPLVRDCHATASFEQTRSLSTVTNYTYANSKFTLLFTKKWEF